MARKNVKREPDNAGVRPGKAAGKRKAEYAAGVAAATAEEEEERSFRAVKREKVSSRGVERERGESSRSQPQTSQDGDDIARRILRSQYRAVMNLISDERDDLLKADSQKFGSIITEVDKLHQLVQKPREQVADAEALLDISSTLVSSVKSHSSEGLTPLDFITGLIKGYGQPTGGFQTVEGDQAQINWKDLGIAVSPIFRKFNGCCTMLGPMDTQLKQRKVAVPRPRTRPAESARPDELDDVGVEEKTDTDKNMCTIFEILKKKKRVRLEALILNRKSFAQTIENLFALSFLVKDGRVEITLNDKGCHFASPMNAPDSQDVLSGNVSYSHFVFRFDYADWKMMMEVIPTGEELMPHRVSADNIPASQAEPVMCNSLAGQSTTPIRIFTRNRGLVIQDETVIEDSPEVECMKPGGTAIRKCKRKIV
ncbi:hypothetical protein MLD38_007349 [Melastoma candidum]|uniref:Uncharacterized protein n=1 Tax=Melastoma candidum TaxID=119954 RepID=A0ACB9RS30_9MYRT|nr:hypothetical protein MLD38_007349 [Melastoma candidum]